MAWAAVGELNRPCKPVLIHAGVCCPTAVEEMLETGKRVLQELHPGAPTRFGFHVPPFNSVLQ